MFVLGLNEVFVGEGALSGLAPTLHKGTPPNVYRLSSSHFHMLPMMTTTMGLINDSIITGRIQ